jgi:hypothetical protein
LEPWTYCKSDAAAHFPTNPVVVESKLAANFAMCSVPKAGCSLLRSLLYVLTHPAAETAKFGAFKVHSVPYPTIWHYRAADHSVLQDTYPTVRCQHVCAAWIARFASYHCCSVQVICAWPFAHGSHVALMRCSL